MNPSLSEKKGIIGPDETLDSWGKGTVQLIQKKTGYRFSIDSLLLFDFVRVKKRDRILDLGTGCGILAMLLAKSNPEVKVVALDLSSEMMELAHRNIRLNRLDHRVLPVQGDLCRLPFFLKKGSFNLMVSNPPYRPLNSGRINPNPQKALARHEIRITLPDLLQAVAHGLVIGGKWFVVYPAERLVSLLTLARKNRLEPKRIRLVHSFKGKRAEWVLMEAVLQGREELKVLPPLFVYEQMGRYDPEIKKRLFFENAGFSQKPIEPEDAARYL